MIFPGNSKIDDYSLYFEASRTNDLLVWDYLKQGKPQEGILKYFS